MLTVTPDSPALSIMRPAASAVTAALRRQNNHQPRTTARGEARKSPAQTYLIVIAHVPVQLVNIMRTLEESFQ